jgi:hypothetical protein
MNESVEAKIIELHPTVTHKMKSQLRFISASPAYHAHPTFHETGFVPDTWRVGHPSKVTSELVSYIEARTIQEPSVSGESMFGEASDESGVSLPRT